jgi:hypothetical protein
MTIATLETDQVKPLHEKNTTLRIQDVYPGSDFFPSRIQIVSIPNPGSASKNKSILTQKNGFQALGNMIRVVRPGYRIRILTFYPSRIPGAPDPGFAIIEKYIMKF